MGQSVHLHDVKALSIKLCFYNTPLQISLTFLGSQRSTQTSNGMDAAVLIPFLLPRWLPGHRAQKADLVAPICFMVAWTKAANNSGLSESWQKMADDEPICMEETHYQASYQYLGCWLSANNLDLLQWAVLYVLFFFLPASRKSLQLKNTLGKSFIQWKEKSKPACCVRFHSFGFRGQRHPTPK